jgi:hypothetical protein
MFAYLFAITGRMNEIAFIRAMKSIHPPKHNFLSRNLLLSEFRLSCGGEGDYILY